MGRLVFLQVPFVRTSPNKFLGSRPRLLRRRLAASRPKWLSWRKAWRSGSIQRLCFPPQIWRWCSHLYKWPAFFSSCQLTLAHADCEALTLKSYLGSLNSAAHWTGVTWVGSHFAMSIQAGQPAATRWYVTPGRQGLFVGSATHKNDFPVWIQVRNHQDTLQDCRHHLDCSSPT